MPRLFVRNADKAGCYFITLTVSHWYYIFDRHNRWQILADSVRYCQKNKGIKVYSYVFMLNHLHMIVQGDDVSGFLRDFKSFTAQAILKNIGQYEPTILKLFQTEQGQNFWKEGNHPVLLESEKFFTQKLHYIHDNPVRKGYVSEVHHWKWSSAHPNSEIVIDEY